MIAVFKNISTSVTKGVRSLKGLIFGKNDIRTLKQISPFGIDSNPTNDKRGIFFSTTTIGKYYSMGVINTNCKAEVGETRIFSTDINGVFQTEIRLRNTGIIEIGGDQDNAVKYTPSKAELDKLKSTVNDLVSKWNSFATTYVPGSPSTTGLPPTLATSTVTPNASNFSLIKNDKIKTNG